MRYNYGMKILNFFKGKKTYLVALLMVALGLLQGEKELVLQGLGFFSLRNAI